MIYVIDTDFKLIEDAAEMIGQTYYGKQCGSFGDVSTFSFYPNKHITTGEGGMILTDDDDLANKCRGIRNLCFQPRKRFVHERLGWNLRMTNIQADLGVAQLEQLDEFLCKKRRIGQLYTDLLCQLRGIQLSLPQTEYALNIYWVFGLILDDSISFDAAEAIDKLLNLGIGCRPFFCPMHQQPVLLNLGLFESESYPVSERMYRRGLYIPSGLSLTENQIMRVCESLRRY